MIQRFAFVLLLAVSTALWAQEPAPGDQWSAPARLVASDLLLAAQLIDGTVIAAGGRGHVLFSTDNGQTWTQSRVPTRATLTALHFVSPDEGWVVGHDSIILHTGDGGETWQVQNYAPADERPLLDVLFKNSLEGLAVGAYGLILETSDGGQNWNEVFFEPTDLAPDDDIDTGDDDAGEDEGDWWDVEEAGGDYHLNDLLAIDGALYMAAEAGHLYRSDDGGVTWLTLPSDYDGSFFGLIEAGDGRLIAVGLRGNVFYSDDRGETWRPSAVPVATTLNSGLRLFDGTIVVAGGAGTLLISHDNGKTFSARQEQDRKGIQTLLQLGAGQLLSIGESGAKMIDGAVPGGERSE